MVTLSPKSRRARPAVLDDLRPLAADDERVLAALARHADQVVVLPGVELAREGRRPHEVLAIRSGEVAVHRGGVEVGRLGPGDVIGAAEELAGDAHDRTYIAATAVRVVVLTGRAYRSAHSQPRRRNSQ
jgi:CRP-like cAMP-binding protein